MDANIKFETSDVHPSSKKSDSDDQVLIDSVDLNKSGYALFQSLDADPSIRDSKSLLKDGADFEAEHIQHALVDLFQCVKVRTIGEITGFTEFKYLQEQQQLISKNIEPLTMIQYIKNSAETLIERITEATAMIRKREGLLQKREA